MQAVSNTLIDTLEQDVSLGIYSAVTGEWELNSYVETVVSDNSASTDDNLFPAESVLEPRRPFRTGLPKGIVNQAETTSRETFPPYRVVSRSSTYKYYHSSRLSDGLGVFDPPVGVVVEHSQPMPTNKIVVGFETTFATPVSVEIYYNDGTDWISTGLYAPDADGRIDLYRQSNGDWGTQITLDDSYYDYISGWWVRVHEMNKPNVGVSIIQISPRLFKDFTDRIINVNVSKSAEDYKSSNPIGSAVATTADITFANEDRLFDNENESSFLYGLIDRNVKFVVDDIVTRSDGVSEGVPQGTFFADDWIYNSDGTVMASSTNRAKFLQETVIENCFFWNLSPEHIVPDIIERFGHANYEINTVAADRQRRIPYTFFKNDQTYWEALQSLAVAEQAVFYFDEQDWFVWESRDYLWQQTEPVWEFRNNTHEGNLHNLIDFEPSFELMANKVYVKYTPYQPAMAGDRVINNVVWEDTDTLALNSEPLHRDMTGSQTQLRLHSTNFAKYHNNGIVNVDGEYMRFNKREGSSVWFDVERGLYDSKQKAHYKDPTSNMWSFYTARWNGSYNKINGNSRHGRHSVHNSRLRIRKPQSNGGTMCHYLGGTSNDQYAMYGCELIFPRSTNSRGEPYYDGQGVAGLVIHSNASRHAYYFELYTTQLAQSHSPHFAEVHAYRGSQTDGTGSGFVWMPTGGSHFSNGVKQNIVPGRRYRLEVFFRRIIDGEGVTRNNFILYLNGRYMFSFNDTVSGSKPTSGYWGVFARGRTDVDFEFAYALDRNNPLTDEDIPTIMESLVERRDGGFNSGALENIWRRNNRRGSDVIFEDFGPMVHEGREYDVDYEIYPNTAADLFISNEDGIFDVFHERDPFRSRFAIVNRTRQSQVVVGRDPRNDNKNQSLFVYGRPIVEQDERLVEREDKLSIKRRGVEELEISSPWTQNEFRANRIADWLIERWGNPSDITNIQAIVCSPLQIGDLVSIRMEDENMTPDTHLYHVV